MTLSGGSHSIEVTGEEGEYGNWLLEFAYNNQFFAYIVVKVSYPCYNARVDTTDYGDVEFFTDYPELVANTQ